MNHSTSTLHASQRSRVIHRRMVFPSQSPSFVNTNKIILFKLNMLELVYKDNIASSTRLQCVEAQRLTVSVKGWMNIRWFMIKSSIIHWSVINNERQIKKKLVKQPAAGIEWNYAALDEDFWWDKPGDKQEKWPEGKKKINKITLLLYKYYWNTVLLLLLYKYKNTRLPYHVIYSM